MSLALFAVADFQRDHCIQLQLLKFSICDEHLILLGSLCSQGRKKHIQSGKQIFNSL